MSEKLRIKETQERQEFGLTIVRRLGDQALDMLQKRDIGVEIKPDGSKVTSIDLVNNDTLLDEFSSAFPEDIIWGEEGGNHPKSKNAFNDHWRWIADPIDSTSNLIRSHKKVRSGEWSNFSQCRSTILLSGFAPGEVVPNLSFIHSPFFAGKPTLFANRNNVQKETLEGERLRVAEIKPRKHQPHRLADVTHFDVVSWRDRRPEFRQVLDEQLPGKRVDRRMSMGAVALGSVDFSVFPSPSNPYDVAPGAHISKAAGLEVTTISGRPFEKVDWLHGPIDGVIVAATIQLARDIQRAYAAA